MFRCYNGFPWIAEWCYGYINITRHINRYSRDLVVDHDHSDNTKISLLLVSLHFLQNRCDLGSGSVRGSSKNSFCFWILSSMSKHETKDLDHDPSSLSWNVLQKCFGQKTFIHMKTYILIRILRMCLIITKGLGKTMEGYCPPFGHPLLHCMTTL